MPSYVATAALSCAPLLFLPPAAAHLDQPAREPHQLVRDLQALRRVEEDHLLIRQVSGWRALDLGEQTDVRVGADVCWRSDAALGFGDRRSEEHTSELQSLRHLVCRLLLEKKK